MLSDRISILFWNVNRKNVIQNLVRLVQGHDANILLVAEANPEQDTQGLLRALNLAPHLAGESEFTLIEPLGQFRPKGGTAMSRFQVFSSLQQQAWEPVAMTNRFAIWKVHLDRRKIFHLVTVHFPAIQQDQGDQQRECAIAMRLDLEQQEAGVVKQNEERLSIIIGDFNANPFDAGIMGVYGLNATHLPDIAANQFRDTNGRRHLYLFNPMWRFLGAEPWGTYYNDALPNPLRSDWYILDQVLVRPDLMPYFDYGDSLDVQILTSDGVVDLNPTLRDKEMPDHRPLLFQFNLPIETAHELTLRKKDGDHV